VVPALIGIHSFVYARMSNVNSNAFPEGTGYGVRGVNPAVSIEHILGDVFCVNTINRISNILTCGHYQRKSQQAHHRKGVVQPEDGAVDVHMADLGQVLQTTEDIQHFGYLFFRLFFSRKTTLIKINVQILLFQD
jgi:hypothetical protein